MEKSWFVILAVLTMFVAGCKENPALQNDENAEMTEQEALAEIISNDAFFTADQALLDDGEPPSSALQKGMAVINPLRWGRRIESASRLHDFAKLTDSTATVAVTNVLTGFIWIRQADTTTSIIKKNFIETTKRIVKLVRVNRLKDKRRNWNISEVSAMLGGSDSSGIEIQKVTFFIGTDTLIITDPLDYFMKAGKIGLGGICSLSPSFTDSLKVRVEVKSADPDSDIVSAHRPYYQSLKKMFRAPMKLVGSTSTGDGKVLRIYENSWKGVWTGRHHAIVGAMTRESIFDDIKPFSSQLWGIPFIVE